jgi:hypothetical protein
LKHIVLALAVLAAAPTAAWAGTVEPLDGGAASVTFPRGAPQAVGRKDVIWAVRDGVEAFTATSSEEPANPELRAMLRTCPKSAEGENAQGKITTRCWESDGDPVKEVTIASHIGDGGLMVVRTEAHAGRTYQLEYVRRGGAGPISADGERFLDSLHVNH